MSRDGWLVRKTANRIVMSCPKCPGFTAIDVQLSHVGDGTEARVRAGITIAKSMFNVCKRNASINGTKCFSGAAVNLRRAVGFVTSVQISRVTYSATYVLWQRGARLVIRNVAPSRKTAEALGRRTFKVIVNQIVE